MSAADPTPALAAERLSLGYGQRRVVEHLSLALPRGAFTALVGPNGSGKSTILRALAGLMAPAGGAVVLDGRSIAGVSPRRLARRVGVLAQSAQAPEGLTVAELVRQGRYAHRSFFGGWSAADGEACARALSLTGMDDLRDRPLDNLSGGQRQRAWIAMTLAQETDILLLDEPTTFLDIAHQIEILDLVTGLVRDGGKTVVAVLHDLNQAARHADHIVFLKDGAVVTAGSPAQAIRAETVASVFGIDCRILADPYGGTPLCIPGPRIPR